MLLRCGLTLTYCVFLVSYPQKNADFLLECGVCVFEGVCACDGDDLKGGWPSMEEKGIVPW